MTRVTLMRALMLVIIAAGALCIVDIWTDVISEVFFKRFLVTCAIIAGVLGLVLALHNDIDDEDGKKKDKYLS